MRWQAKFAVQRACACVPFASQALYYRLQQRFGPVTGLYDPSEMLREAVRMSQMAAEYGRPVAGASILEVGSGWRVDIPLGFFLCGAKEVYTFDLNRYVREELVLRSINYLRTHEANVRSIFEAVLPAEEIQERLSALQGCHSLDEVLYAAQIHYQAPADAAATGLPEQSIDLHFSYTVFEHIPAPVLVTILREAGRLLRPGGVALHHIDLSDHFAHVDASIPLINFLKFPDWQWRCLASTPWSYHNRLRVDDYAQIYREARQNVLGWRPHVDQKSCAAIANGFPLAQRYRDDEVEKLCTVYLDVISTTA